MVGLGRFELPASPLSGVRSDQLSYRPGFRAHPRAWEAGDQSSFTGTETGNLCWGLAQALSSRWSFKGGDPAARSRTATLLRLHPSH